MVLLRRGIVGLAALAALAPVRADFDGPAPIAWRWADMVGARPAGAPIVSGDVVYAAVGSRMYALDRSTGNQLWRFPSGEPLQANFTTGALLSGNTLIAAADDKAVYGVDVKTGEMKWQYIAPAGIYTKPVLAQNYVVFGLSSNNIIALDAQTGNPIWSEAYTPGSTVYDSLASWQGIVYFLSSDGQLTALDVSSKRDAWRPRRLSAVSPFSGLSVFGDVLYVTSGSYVTALSASTGAVRWEQLVQGVLRQKAAAGPEGVVVVTDDGRMHAFSTAGRPAFRNGIDLGSSAVAAPAFAGRFVAIPTANGALNLIDPASGDVVWNFTVPPMIKGMKVEVGGAAGTTGGGLSGAGRSNNPGGGGGNQGGGPATMEIKSVMAAGNAVTSGDMLLLLAQDGSILAFDKNLGVDLTAPEVTMGWPNAGDQVSGRAPMELVFMVSDEGSGVNYDSMKITINSQEYIGEVDRDGRIRVRILQGSPTNKPLPNGRARIIVSVSDWMKNTNAANFILTIDNTLPPLGSPRLPEQETGGGNTGLSNTGGGGGLSRTGGGGGRSGGRTGGGFGD
jgi:outer membrane protein assembly factor BamB